MSNPNSHSSNLESAESKTVEQLLSNFSSDFFAQYPAIDLRYPDTSLGEWYEKTGKTDVHIADISSLYEGEEKTYLVMVNSLIDDGHGKKVLYRKGYWVHPLSESKESDADSLFDQLSSMESVHPELVHKSQFKEAEIRTSRKSKISTFLGRLASK